MMEKENNYMFYDYETGERFFVQTDDYETAEKIAIENFGNDIAALGKYTDTEAEWFGYDTY